MAAIAPGDTIQIKLHDNLTIDVMALTMSKQRMVAVAEEHCNNAESADEQYELIHKELLPAALPGWSEEQIDDLVNNKINVSLAGVIARTAMGTLTEDEEKKFVLPRS